MKKLIPVALCIMLFASCKKESEQYATTQISEYAPLAAGKYITYDLDSLVYVGLSTVEQHHFYQVKYAVADSFTDLLGRKAFRILRSIRNSGSTGAFAPDNTFVAVNTGNSFEFTENNLRFLKLVLPFKEGGTWKGNSAIDVSSLGSDQQYLFDWDYTYSDVDQAKKVGNVNLASTVTINQRDESFNLPVTASTNIASRDYSQEIYAKGIGMVYKNFLHFEYQSSYNGYIGYGIKLTMVDHN